MAMFYCILIYFIPTCFSQSKLNLSTSNVIDIFGVYNTKMNVRNLLDEQTIAGDPLNDPSNALPCKSPWLPSLYNEYYPVTYPEYPGPAAVIVLESIYKLTNICIYIMNNNSSNWVDFIVTWNFTVYNPFEPPTLSFPTKINLKWANHWNCFNTTNVISGFVTVSLHNMPATSFTEVVLYGQKYTKTSNHHHTKSKNFTRVKPKQLKHLMGSTGYGWMPTDNFTNTIGVFRQWQMWPWIEGGDNHNYPGYPNNENRYECTTVTGANAYCQDDVLKKQRENNVNVHAVLWTTPGWIHNWNQSESGWKPISDDILHQYGATVNPNSYIMFADHLFQKTARYGRVEVSHNLLKLAPNI
eukprot:321772_1